MSEPIINLEALNSTTQDLVTQGLPAGNTSINRPSIPSLPDAEQVSAFNKILSEKLFPDKTKLSSLIQNPSDVMGWLKFDSTLFEKSIGWQVAAKMLGSVSQGLKLLLQPPQ